MPNRGASLRVDGLKELRRALKEIDPALTKQLQQANKHVVEQVVLPAAKQNATKHFRNAKGNDTHLGHVGAATIRATATQREAYVALGSARVPWAAGFEWGSSGQFSQFPARSGVSSGFILFPVVKAKQDEIMAAYTAMLDELADQAFPE